MNLGANCAKDWRTPWRNYPSPSKEKGALTWAGDLVSSFFSSSAYLSITIRKALGFSFALLYFILNGRPSLIEPFPPLISQNYFTFLRSVGNSMYPPSRTLRVYKCSRSDYARVLCESCVSPGWHPKIIAPLNYYEPSERLEKPSVRCVGSLRQQLSTLNTETSPSLPVSKSLLSMLYIDPIASSSIANV